MSKSLAPTPDRPRLVIRDRDEAQLQRIAISAMLTAPRLAGALLDELSRAVVLPDAEVAPDVIGLGSVAAVRERDEAGVRHLRAQIVAPEDSDPGRDRVSVLTDLGAALLGLSSGQSILWRDRWGGMREITIGEVHPPQPL